MTEQSEVTQPRDDVNDRYQEALRTIQQVVEDAAYCVKTDTPYSPFIKALNEVHEIADAALATTTQPDTKGTACGTCGGKKRIPVTTISSAPDAGWADCPKCSTQPDTDSGLAGELAAMRIQGQREGKAAVCAWLRHFTAIKPASEGAEKVAALADMFEQSERACSALAEGAGK